MFVTKAKMARTMMVIALTCSGVGLTGVTSLLAVQTPAILAPPPQDNEPNLSNKDAGNEDAKERAETSPVGLVHDFGKVQRGTQLKHAFRIVNTSDVPLRIISVYTH